MYYKIVIESLKYYEHYPFDMSYDVNNSNDKDKDIVWWPK